MAAIVMLDCREVLCHPRIAVLLVVVVRISAIAIAFFV